MAPVATTLRLTVPKKIIIWQKRCFQILNPFQRGEVFHSLHYVIVHSLNGLHIHRFHKQCKVALVAILLGCCMKWQWMVNCGPLIVPYIQLAGALMETLHFGWKSAIIRVWEAGFLYGGSIEHKASITAL